MSVRAVLFDFNGTLSDDEPLLCEIWRELFSERGRPLSAERYFDELAGLSDPEIAARWLGEDHPGLAELMEERVRRYRERVGDGSTVSTRMREAMRFASGHVPVAVVSGAAREEVELVLGAAGLAGEISVIVAAEDVERGKPDPEGYVRALAGLGVDPGEAVVFEDSEAGVVAGKGAGAHVIAVTGTLPRDRLAQADEIVERIDLELLRRVLG